MMVTFWFFAALLCIRNFMKIVTNTFCTNAGLKEHIGIAHNGTYLTEKV